MDRINKFLNKNIANIIIVLLVLNPILDLFTSLSMHVLSISFNFLIILKGLFILILLYYYLVCTNNKNKFCNFLLLMIFLYLIIFCTNIIIIKNTSVLFYEMSNTIKTFFLPITIITFYSIYKNNKLKIKTSTLVFILIEYLILLLIPILTHTGFNSYAHSKVGTIGWFNSTNEIGAIISILLPILFYKLIYSKNKKLMILLSLIIMLIYMTIGTKTPTLTLILTLTLLLIFLICKLVVNKKYLSVIVTILIALIVGFGAIKIIPKTSFYENIMIHLNFLGIDEISDFADVHIIDHFIFSERIKFMEVTSKNYLKVPLIEKLIGIGYVENFGTDNVNLKMVEMDYYDIFFRHGIIGFILFFLPIIYIVKKEFTLKHKYEFKHLIYDFSIILILVLSLFTGHILIAPSVSLIVAIMILNWLDIHNNKKKNILFTAYDLNLGGIETALINLLDRMDYQKYNITLILEKKEGIFLERLNNKINVIEYKVYNNKNVLIRKLLNLFNKIKFIILNYKEYDFSCCYATYSLSGNVISRLASSNSVIYIHNNYLHLYDNDISKVKEFFDCRSLNQFKKIIFVSNESKDDFLTIYPQYKDKSLVINNFVDHDLIIEKANEKIKEKKNSKTLFVSVGRLDEHQKRLSRQLNLFKELKDMELWIIGDGPDKKTYESEIKKHKINNIKMLGKKSNPYPYIKEADYIILTSDYEGFPVVYMEAITLNKPIITTVNVSDDYINIKNNYGVIISKDDNMIKEVKEIIKKGFKPKKLDYKKMNEDKMKKVEQLIEGE